MKLESEDLKQITEALIEGITPFLMNNKKSNVEDTIFDVHGLAEYLKLPKSWIDRQVQLKTIPYFKCGKYNRFKKSAIDKWAEQRTIRPISPLEIVKHRG